MDGYNNDYNKDLYTAQSSDFCKSCYSSGKSREGCLVCLGAALGTAAVYIVLNSVAGTETAVLVTALAVALTVAARIKKSRGNKNR